MGNLLRFGQFLMQEGAKLVLSPDPTIYDSTIQSESALKSNALKFTALKSTVQQSTVQHTVEPTAQPVIQSNLQPTNLETVLSQVNLSQVTASYDSAYGLIIALGIIAMWCISLVTLLSFDIANVIPRFVRWLIPLAILWQTFLYTGLFITAHDAMHGAVHSQRQINRAIGSLAVLLYGFFSYQQLFQKHWLHHHYPASDRDPDFHDGRHKNPLSWYLYFMTRYWNWKQLFARMALFYFMQYALGIPERNLLLFWIIPAILSSVQLFYFGTFLPHREPATGYHQPHRATTQQWPVFWSLITCYHFGYHQEHHTFPQVPWWQLPKVHQQVHQQIHQQV